MASQADKYRTRGDQLTDSYFDRRFLDIDLRCTRLEEQMSRFDQATSSLVERGLQLIQQQVQESVAAVLQAVANVRGQFDDQIEAVQSAVAALNQALEAAETAVGQLEQIIADIIAEGNLPASGILVAPISGLSAANVQEALAAIISGLAGKANADGSNLTGRLANSITTWAADLNQLRQTGWYFGNAPGGTLNTPAGVNWGLVMVVERTGATTYQEWITTTSPYRRYYRWYTYGNDTWTAWTDLPNALATQAEAEAGTNAAAYMSPLRVAQAISARIGTTAGKIVALDGTGKLPALNASQLTNLPAPGIADVTGLSDALAAKLNASAYTAADVLAKLLTVDGANSGLDAARWRGAAFTISTAPPSGGADGDFWFEREA